MAYIGIGKSLLRQGEYKQAMTFLRLGNDREYYSKALTKYRREYMREHFGPILAKSDMLCNALHLLQLKKEQARRFNDRSCPSYNVQITLQQPSMKWISLMA